MLLVRGRAAGLFTGLTDPNIQTNIGEESDANPQISASNPLVIEINVNGSEAGA